MERCKIYVMIVIILKSTVTAQDTRAYITVTATASKDFDGKSYQVSPISIEGLYARIGSVENIEGDVCMIDKDFLLNLCRSTKSNSHWIGVIDLDDEDEVDLDPDDERDNRGNRKQTNHKKHSKSKSFTDKVKDIMLLGASALIIMAKNVKVRKEFDVAHVFTRPVILLQGVENVTKILQLFSLKYDLYAKIQRNISYYNVVGSIGTVTLWATCGRSTSGSYHEWQGVVCLGSNQIAVKAIDEYLNAMAWNAFLLIFIGLLVYIYIRITRSGIMLDAAIDSEDANDLLAKHIISRMDIEIYRSRGRTSCKRSRRSLEGNERTFQNLPEQCVICLDAFFPMQRLRVLPCNHRFHLNCIDRWLLMRYTCPMCKFNILEDVIKEDSTFLQAT